MRLYGRFLVLGAVCAALGGGAAAQARTTGGEQTHAPAVAHQLILEDFVNALKGIDYRLGKQIHRLGGIGYVSPFKLAAEIRAIEDRKHEIIRKYLDMPVYGVAFRAYYFELSCIDRRLDEARSTVDAGIEFLGGAEVPLDYARNCLKALRKKVSKAGQAPADMSERLDKLEKLIDRSLGETKRKDISSETFKKHLFDVEAAKHNMISTYITQDFFGLPLDFVYDQLYEMDQALDAAFDAANVGLVKPFDRARRRRAKEALKRAREAKLKIEDNLHQTADVSEGAFGTWAHVDPYNYICVYIRGPVAQQGSVTLSGPNILSPNPVSFTIDTELHALVSFKVEGPGTWSFVVQRTQADGSSKQTQSDSVTIATGGSTDHGPAPPDQFGTAPCP